MKDLFDLNRPVTKRAVYIALCAVVILIVVFIALLLANRPASQTERVVGTAPPFASRCWTASGIPPGCVYGLSNVRYLILSAFAYEGNLIGGEFPVGDWDYMLGWGIQQRVKLPGGSWNRYHYYGAVWVQGSGCVLEFAAPNGGRFALLHMAQRSYGCAATAHRVTSERRPTYPVGLSGDERTALAASKVLRVGAPAVSSLAGGHWVGYSRWPDWGLYGNGSCCQLDAHLCVVLDGKARSWFERVGEGRDRPPWHFNWTRWKGWTVPHHEKTIPAFRSPKCAGKRSCLTWPAAIFDKHQRLGGKRPWDEWFHPKGQRGYNKYHFRHGVAFAWPSNGAVKIVYS
jgi:hypothetical protein